VARGGDAVGEADDELMDAGDFVDDDDGRAGAAAEDVARPLAVSEVEFRVIGERKRSVGHDGLLSIE
jgi:hypothetical protein